MKRILVVDDNEMLCRLACDILRAEGIEKLVGPIHRSALSDAVAEFLKNPSKPS